MPDRDEYLVFISHASDDAWIARKMAQTIEERGRDVGVTTFLDAKDIEGGDVFTEAIVNAIERCSELVVLLSSSSIDRQWVLAEIGAAIGQRKRVVGVIDKLSFDDIPDVLGQRKAVNLNQFDQYVDALINRARQGKHNG